MGGCDDATREAMRLCTIRTGHVSEKKKRKKSHVSVRIGGPFDGHTVN